MEQTKRDQHTRLQHAHYDLKAVSMYISLIKGDTFMKTIIVWSGGSKNAKTAKINAVMSGITLLLLISLHIITIVRAFLIHDFDAIFTAIILLFTVGWITALMLFSYLDSRSQVKTNKKIPLYLFPIDDFAKIGCIPENKFVLFSDKNGIVLAENKYRKESKDFAWSAKRFANFTNYNHIENTF